MLDRPGIDRRALFAGLSTAACVGAAPRADAAPELDPRVEAAFASTPAALSAGQRAAVRGAVRSVAQILEAARKMPLDASVPPAAVFFPKVPR